MDEELKQKLWNAIMDVIEDDAMVKALPELEDGVSSAEALATIGVRAMDAATRGIMRGMREIRARDKRRGTYEH